MSKINPAMLAMAVVGITVASPATAATIIAPAQSGSSDFLLAASSEPEPTIVEWSSFMVQTSRQSPLLVPGDLSSEPAPGTPAPSAGASDNPRGSPLLVVPGEIVSPVPEPTTWALMILGFGLVGSALRRRRGAMRPRYNIA